MRRLWQLSLTLIIATGISGCTDGGAANVSSSPTVPVGSTVYDSGSEAGVITGTVTDEEIVALQGVKVTLVELNLEVLTDAAGSFEFRDVPLREYRVAASRIGYMDRILNAKLEEANQTVKLEFILTAIVIPDSYHLTTTYNGKISCGILLVPVCGIAQDLPVNPSEEKWIFEWTYQAGVEQPVMMITEMDWKSSVPGTSQKLIPTILIAGDIAQSSSGPSPIRMESDADQMKSWFKQEKQIGVYPELADPVVDQRFTIHRTDFWGTPAPEGWSTYNATQ